MTEMLETTMVIGAAALCVAGSVGCRMLARRRGRSPRLWATLGAVMPGSVAVLWSLPPRQAA